MISHSTLCAIESNDEQVPYMKLGNTFTPTKTCTPRLGNHVILHSSYTFAEVDVKFHSEIIGN